MRIMRSKGTSYTRFEGREQREEKVPEGGSRTVPSRGLKARRQRGDALNQSVVSSALTPGADLPDYLEEEVGIALRQYIQWLDKVLSKPRSLRRMDLDSYRARTFLGECLWDLFASVYVDEDGSKSELAEQAKLKEIWRAKIHPYAKHIVNWQNPDSDKNAKEIRGFVGKRPEYRRQKRVSETSWTKNTFYIPFGSITLDDYRPAAIEIQKHLREQEIKASGKPRSRKHGAVNGFIRERGDAIAQSVTDPRIRSKRRDTGWGEKERQTYKKPGDVAASIQEAIVFGERGARPRKLVGELLYKHFGEVGGADKENFKPSKPLWNLHNATRLYYRRVIQTKRFLEAVRGEDTRKLKHLLPSTLEELFVRVEGARNGQELQRQIRLGKLIAHSIDLCMVEDVELDNAVTDDFDAMVRAGMDYFVTSVGQADIKRNEAFVRVLRTSVAFAQRTLDAWVQPGLAEAFEFAKKQHDKAEIEIILERDITTTAVGARAIKYLDGRRPMDHGRVIFGSRVFPKSLQDQTTGEMISVDRTSILFDGTETDKEVLWGLLRYASRVRDHSYHFNTKGRLLKRISDRGILEAFGPKEAVSPFVERGSTAHKLTKDALDRINKLLDFDLQIEASVLALELNRINFAQYTPTDKREETLALIGRGPATDDWITPKFMTVLNKAHSLATGDTMNKEDPLLWPFGALVLHDLSKGKANEVVDEITLSRAVNHDRIGLLRLVYDRAFPSWLEWKEKDEAFARKIFAKMLKAKRNRQKEYEKAKKQSASLEETWAERLLQEATTLSDMELLLQSEALLATETSADDDRLLDHFEALADAETSINLEGATDEAVDQRRKPDPYVPNRQLQQEQSYRLQEFRRELYAYLFASFLNDKLPGNGASGLPSLENSSKAEFASSWVWTMELAVTGDTSTGEVTAQEIADSTLTSAKTDYPEWLRLFYAWLYLVPPDAVAQLQHQFRKTAILERKAALDRADILWSQNPKDRKEKILRLLGPDPRKPTDQKKNVNEKLRQIDRVMGLYTRVQAAGFAGTEIDFGKSLFQNANDYAALLPAMSVLTADQEMDEPAETAPMVLKGTLAGLRQMKRFNTLPLLNKTFKKHKVTENEFDIFKKQSRDLMVFNEKQRLHKVLREGAKAKTRNDAEHLKSVKKYKELAESVCKYNFAISAARLADFAEVQHLLMAILARLTDFSALWERDRDCAVLAACFEMPNLRLVKEKSVVRFENGTDFLAEIYDRSAGFRFASGKIEAAQPSNLSAETLNQFRRFFGLFRSKGEERKEHAKDEAYRLRRNPELAREGSKIRIKPNVGHHLALHQIRNDLAHFNILDRKPDLKSGGALAARQDINLTYVINSVRALLGHDRKLKNAVPKAIADILQRRGFALSWSFSRDRLRTAELRPALLPHLAFLTLKLDNEAGKPERRPMTFYLPRVSPRQLSMTRALFDFGSSGYLGEGAGPLLTYPQQIVEELQALGVPSIIAKHDQSGSE